MSLDIAAVAAAIVAFTLISRRIQPTIISPPMVFVAAGLLCGPELTDLVDLGVDVHEVALIGEAALAIVLFADATRIDTRMLSHELALPVRLLGISLPLTIAAGTGIAALLLTDASGWEAALVAAILAPTDAALGDEVVTDEAVPARIRQTLTVESGLNDGLVVPAVSVFLVLATAEGESRSAGFWARFVVEQVGIGLVVGLVVGGGGAWLLARAERADWVDGIYAQLATLALAVGSLAVALELGGNGFIAAFVAGLAFGRVSPRSDELNEYTEDTAQLAAMLSFFLFGNVLLGPALDDVSVLVVVCAVGVLTVGRMVPVAIALAGSGVAPTTVGFIGWFGPRGLASILFGLLLLEEDLAAGEELFGVVAWTVLLSVVLHGASAAWGARRYGRWWIEMNEDRRQTMPEAVDVTGQRARR